MSNKDLHRHDLTDEQWSILAPILPGQRGQWGGIAKDNQLFMIWEMEQCSSKISSVGDAGVRERILSAVAKRPDFEWLMIDASHCKVQPHAAGAIGGNESMDRTKGGSI